MFIYRTRLLVPQVANYRNFAQLSRSGNIFRENVQTSLIRGKTPFRFFSKNRAGDRIEQELAQQIIRPMKITYLVRPFIFTVGVSTASIVGATIWEYEFVRAQVKKMMNSSVTFFQHKQKNFSDLKGAWNRFVNGELKEAWSRLSPGDQFFIPICGLNLLVFGLWRIPRLQTMLLKNFSANPIGLAPCRSMLLSVFSHYSFFHIFANMYVLNSFCNGICMALGREQTLALYLSAGCVASFASYFHKVFAGVGGASLGASGAILGILGYVCTRFPDTQLQIMFLPMFQFSADSAIKVIMAIDVIGCVLGWRYFDHAAHLGGALFGIFWCHIGEKHIWPQRKYITEKWHNLRSACE
ncbi:presenilins-associated rhomboid-like protein, mitochondrial [Contarinia nasturtii]|uniref:presenilins-associated rhomboid-like protein, mitochondrial n=1 Tax=Contarinia nasturtii TaxID=265458 RepID=UPI0012D3DD1D|nr:presenilins-associated rhomboid-like protein, mitochondrial [Contarinia nasturtii]